MEIIEAEADNFLSLDHVCIPFQNQGLVCIKGENHDSQGMDSNGAGKSSLYEIVPWTIWGTLIRGSVSVDDVVNRARPDRGCFGRIEFTVNGDSYEILRARSHSEHGTKLVLETPDQTYDGKKRAVQEEIERVVSLDKDLFSSTSYFGQGDFKRFSELTDSERKDVFRNLLYLHRFNDYRSTAKAKRDEVEERRKELESSREKLEVREDSLETDVEELEDKVESVQQEIDELEKERQGLEEEVDSNIEDLEDDIEEFGEKRDNLLHKAEDLEERKEALSEESEELNDKLAEKRKERDELREEMEDKISDRQASVREELSDLRDEKSDVTDKRSEIENDITEANSQITSKKEELDTLEGRIEDADEEIEKVEGKIEELSETDTCPTCGQEVEPDDLDEHRTELIETKERYENKKAELQEKKDTVEQEIEALEEAVEEAEERVDDQIRKRKDLEDQISDLEEKQKQIRESVQEGYDFNSIKAEIEEISDNHSETIKERDSVAQELSDVRQEVMELKNQIENLQRDIDDEKDRMQDIEGRIENKESTLGTYEEDLREKEQKLSEVRDDIDEITEELEDVQEQYEVYDFWVDGFGPEEIQSILLDSVVPFLNDRVSHYTELICDGTYQIDFRTRVPYKSKDGFKDDFSIKIQTEGQEPADYSLYSGGEKQRIDICIMMALHDLSQSVTGRSLDCVIYDEFFSRVDGLGSQRLGELLVEQKEIKDSIFVVTHNQDLSQSGIWDQIWTVTKQDGLSNLEMQ